VFFPLLIANAAEVGTVRGVVHNPEHRPLPGATIVLRNSAFSKTAAADADGEFQMSDVPEGAYTIAVSAQSFRPFEQQITVAAGKEPVLHLQLELAPVNSSIEVSGAANKLNTQTFTVQTAVDSQEISHTPGAYMVHDMLPMRGGHEVNWFFDGIPVVNTNIAANVAPLINPKMSKSWKSSAADFPANTATGLTDSSMS
jgi:hypothetical protein